MEDRSMAASIVWAASTALFWFLLSLAANGIETAVGHYHRRVIAMAMAGTAIGALAAAVGYAFGPTILGVFLLQLFVVHRQAWLRLRSIGLLPTARLVTKYSFLGFLLLTVAALGSYVFAFETCTPRLDSCHRLFFERIYTPPHLR
jgi:hypothetical protein